MERLSDFTSRMEAQEKALAFSRYVTVLTLTKGDHTAAGLIYLNRWPGSRHKSIVQKAAVAAGTTTADGWASALVDMRVYADAFMALVRPRTVIDRLQGVRLVPTGVRVPAQTAGASVGWVGEAAAARVSKLDLQSILIKRTKTAGIVALSKELLQSSDPNAEQLVQNDLVAAIATCSDESLLDPTKAEAPDLNGRDGREAVTPAATAGCRPPLFADLTFDGRMEACYSIHVGRWRCPVASSAREEPPWSPRTRSASGTTKTPRLPPASTSRLFQRARWGPSTGRRPTTRRERQATC